MATEKDAMEMLDEELDQVVGGEDGIRMTIWSGSGAFGTSSVSRDITMGSYGAKESWTTQEVEKYKAKYAAMSPEKKDRYKYVVAPHLFVTGAPLAGL